ncbi:MAG: metal ABC transporter ATP-binding protein [Pseudomonadota bacterium]
MHRATQVETLQSAPLAVRGLTVSYGEKPAVFSVDMTLRAGAMTAIIGPNGAGKSTLLKAALGVVTPLSGHVTAFGLPISAARDRIAYVPQRASVDWDFPVRVIDVVLMGLYGQLGLLGQIRGRHKARAIEALARVGMTDFAQRQIGQLSGGQQQRVFLARALAQGADLYLLDEPFAGVDAATEAAIVDVLRSLRDEGKTIAVVHHDLSTVEAYFDDVFLLNTQEIATGPVATTFTDANLAAAYGGRLQGRPAPLPGALA